MGLCANYARKYTPQRERGALHLARFTLTLINFQPASSEQLSIPPAAPRILCTATITFILPGPLALHPIMLNKPGRIQSTRVQAARRLYVSKHAANMQLLGSTLVMNVFIPL